MVENESRKGEEGDEGVGITNECSRRVCDQAGKRTVRRAWIQYTDLVGRSGTVVKVCEGVKGKWWV